MGPATTAQQVAAALSTAVDSGEFTTSLQLAGQAGALLFDAAHTRCLLVLQKVG